MVDTQIRAYRSLPEVRRILRKLTDMANADAKRLAGFRRVLNVSSLLSTESLKVLAAKPIIKSKARRALPDLEDESDDASSVKMARNLRSLKSKEPAAKPVIKKSATKTKPVPEPEEDEDEDNDAANVEEPDDSIKVRGRSRGGKLKPQAPEEKLSPAVLKTANGLSDLLRKHQNSLQLAEHVRQTLVHGFSDQGNNTANRMLDLTNTLITQSRKDYHETRKLMHKLGEAHFPPSFKQEVTVIEEELQKKLKGQYESFDTMYALVTGHYGKNRSDGETYPATFFIAYLSFDNLKGPKSMSDYVINLVQVAGIGADKEKGSRLNAKQALLEGPVPKRKSKVADRNRVLHDKVMPTQNFVHVVASYKSPVWVSENNLGVEFTSANDAVRKVLGFMQLDGIIGNAFPSAIPLAKKDLKFTHPSIQSAIIDSKNGKLRVVLKSTVNTQAKADKVYTDVANDVKRLITIIHPRYRNPINAQKPVEVVVPITVKGAVTKQKRWAIDFEFRKSDDVNSIETDIPRDFWKTLKNHLGVDDNRIADIQKAIKNELGMRA